MQLPRAFRRATRFLFGAVAALLVITAATAKGHAEGILFMPIASQMRVGEQQINYSLVNLSEAGQGDLTLYEAYYGLSDALEISLVKVKQTGGDKAESFNVSYLVSPETPYNWASTMGVSNVGGDQYLGDDDPSYYIAFYRTRSTAARPRSARGPSYRYHFGYGTNVHDGFFGGVQSITGSRTWIGAFNYTGQPTYLIDYALLQPGDRRGKGQRLSLRAGYFHGDSWIGLSYSANSGG